MTPNELYITLAAVEGELHNTLLELFAMFCIEHREAGSQNVRQAFSNIIKNGKYVENIEKMDHAFNRHKVYEAAEDGSFELRDEITLEILDSIFVYDVLQNVKGFPTYKAKLKRRRRNTSCKQDLHQQCCMDCNHKCLKCDRKVCKDEQFCHPGEKCIKHCCRNCQETKTLCLHSSSVCCKTCGTCFYCSVKYKIEPDERCDRLRLIGGIDELKNFRLLMENLTFEDCKCFLSGTKTFSEFPLCKILNELSSIVVAAYKEVLHYASEKSHFKRQHAVSQKTVQIKINSLVSMFRCNDSDSLLFTQQKDIIKILGFVNESKTDPSLEYNTIIKKIEELNQDDRYHRDRSTVLFEREFSDFVEIELDSVTAENIERFEEDVVDTGDSLSEEEDEEEDEDEGDEENDENDQQEEEIDIVSKFDDTSIVNEQTYLLKQTVHQPTDIDNRIEKEVKSQLSDALDQLTACVNEIKEHSKTVESNFKEDLNSYKEQYEAQRALQKEFNQKIAAQLTTITEKLISLDTATKLVKDEYKKEIEDIKKNQKNLMDLFQAQQNSKAKKKQGIFKTK